MREIITFLRKHGCVRYILSLNVWCLMINKNLIVSHNHMVSYYTMLLQVDKLAAETLHCKTAAKKGTQEIESFRHALSDMHSSLKVYTAVN